MRKLPVLVAGVVSAAALLATAPASSAATANPNPNNTDALYILHMADDDYIYNYDFNSANHATTNVDWAVSLVFTKNATVNKIKDILAGKGYSEYSDARKWSYLADDSSQDAQQTLDTDRGRKGIICPAFRTTNHYRIYADPRDDKMFNLSYGYWTYATTHTDTNECSPGTKHGASEHVEQDIANKMDNAGYLTEREKFYLYNAEPYRVEGNHYWSNSGRGTYITVP